MCIHKLANKHQCFKLFFFLSLKPSSATDCQMGAWRMGNHHVPPIGKNVKNIALIMVKTCLGRQKVTGIGIMSSCPEGITDNTTEFTGYEDFHDKDLAVAGSAWDG